MTPPAPNIWSRLPAAALSRVRPSSRSTTDSATAFTPLGLRLRPTLRWRFVYARFPLIVSSSPPGRKETPYLHPLPHGISFGNSRLIQNQRYGLQQSPRPESGSQVNSRNLHVKYRAVNEHSGRPFRCPIAASNSMRSNTWHGRPSPTHQVSAPHCSVMRSRMLAGINAAYGFNCFAVSGALGRRWPSQPLSVA